MYSGRAQKAEAVRQAFEDAFGEDQPVLFRLCAEDLEDQLLLAHAAGAGNIEFLGDLGEVGNIFFFELGKANAHLVASFDACFFHMSLTFMGEN